MQIRRYVAAVAVALAIGSGSWLAAQSGAPTLEQAKVATYTGIYEKQPVALKNGVYEGTPFAPGGASRPRVELIDPGMVTGDVGNSGRIDAVVVLSESSGGSGTQLYLAVLTADGATVRNTATALVGDRVQVRSLAVAKGAIVMETVEAGPNDAMCCPTAKLRRTWTLAGGALKEAKAESQGTVSLADLERRVWTLTSLNWKDPLPAGAIVTAEFKDGRISGAGGCNRYTAGVKAGDGAQRLTIGQAAATRMMCEGDRMTVEGAFLKALGTVTSFSFLPGARLALTYREAEATRSLVFYSGSL